MKHFLTTKRTKATKGSDIFDYKLVLFVSSFEKLNLDCATGRLMKEPTGRSALIPSLDGEGQR
jgi:hypothetical protein